MPMYEYHCKQHGNYTRIRPVSERKTSECPKCGNVCPLGVSAPRGINGGFYDKVTRVS